MPSIAIIGASNDPKKFGHAAVLAFRDVGWTVHPVNPSETMIEGLAVFQSVADVPQPLDWISLYVPPKVGLTLLAGFRQAQVKQIWLNPGSESDELIQAARENNLPIVTACSIRAIGKNPADYF